MLNIFLASANGYISVWCVIQRCFDKIYCLSLQRRPDRWARVQALASKFDLKIKRVISERLDRELESSYYYKKRVNPFTRLFGMQSMISCSHGHRKIWEDIARHNYKRALIFEDDVVASDQFCEQIFSRAWQELPEDWDRVYLGHFDVPLVGYLLGRAPQKINEQTVRPQFPTLAHAYAITGNHARELLHDCGRIKWYIDYEMALHSMQNRKVYALVPDLMQQYDFADSEQAVNVNRNLLLKSLLATKNVEHFYSVRLLKVFSYEITVGSVLIGLLGILSGLFLQHPVAVLGWSALVLLIYSMDLKSNYPRIFNTTMDISAAIVCFLLAAQFSPAYLSIIPH